MVSVAIGIFRVHVDVFAIGIVWVRVDVVTIGIFRVSIDIFVDIFSELFEPLKEICVFTADSTELNAHHLFVFYSHELNLYLRAFLWEFDHPVLKIDINGLFLPI